MCKFLIRTTKTTYCLLSASNYLEAYTLAKANTRNNEGICYVKGFSESEIQTIKELVKFESVEAQYRRNCLYFTNNKYLYCTVNPTGTCYNCQYFEPVQQ